MGKLLQLPTELLLLILKDVDKDGLLSLSRSSRRLHYIALPILVARQGHADIDLFSQTFSFSELNFKVLAVLRMALFISSLKKLSCRFSDLDNATTLSHWAYHKPIEEIFNLKCFVSKLSHVEEAIFDIGKLAYWYINIDNSSRIRDLLDTIASVCSVLTVNSNSRVIRRSHYSYPALYDDSQKGSDLIQFINPQVIRHLIARMSWPKSRIGFKPSTVERFTIETPMLFEQPMLYEWTVEIINASCLVSLAIHITEISQHILHTTLPLLVIPTLQELSLRCKVTCNDLTKFLYRHQGLTTLTIGNEVDLPDPSRPPPNSFLSQLATLHASPEYLVYFLKPSHSLPNLGAISVLSYVPLGPCLEISGIHNVLAPIAYRMRNLSVALKLLVVSDNTDPAYPHLCFRSPAGGHTLASSWWHLVTSFQLELAAALPSVFRGDALHFFPSWLATFPPRLEHVSLVGPWFASTEQRARVSLVRLIKASYPGAHTITLDNERRTVADWLS